MRKAEISRRLDVELVQRGLAPSRAQAREAIETGKVVVNGVPASKAGQVVTEGAVIEAVSLHPWVSRGGIKLTHALDAFDVDVEGRHCLDIGASTGGFTDVLLSRGARRVVAVDVGIGQLHARLRDDSRVVSLESTDARSLVAAMILEPPTLLVCDASTFPAASGVNPMLTIMAMSRRIAMLHS